MKSPAGQRSKRSVHVPPPRAVMTRSDEMFEADLKGNRRELV